MGPSMLQDSHQHHLDHMFLDQLFDIEYDELMVL